MGSRSFQLNPAWTTVECSASGESQPDVRKRPIGLCGCCRPAMPLVLRYDAARVRRQWDAEGTGSEGEGRRSIARYEAWLPVQGLPDYWHGVGRTPTWRDEALTEELGVQVFLKAEASNPSGSFKDRGLSVAIALGSALGAKRFCLPTQGNAGVAAAMFCARLGLPPCEVWMPTSHAGSYYHRAAAHWGAKLVFFGSNIAEAGVEMRRSNAAALTSGDVVDVSTFLEPGRLEGKKTLGLEIFEAFGEALPDAIVYPTGGGTGLVGIAKAFEELRAAGLLSDKASLPRLFAVQADGCAPVVQAFDAGASLVKPVVSRGTSADGLNVPGAIMGHRILRAIRDSSGAAISVAETALHAGSAHLSGLGVSTGLEGGATLAGLRQLRRAGAIPSASRVLLLLTSGPSAALAAPS